jgi:hypothetical protein
MPINENEFGKSDRAPSLLLMEFLSTNYRSAYTLDEIEAAMKTKSKDLTKKDMERLLTALEYGGKVKSREIDGKTYYRYSKIAGLKLI